MRRKFGFNKKICSKLLIVDMCFQHDLCNTHAEHEWVQGTFLRKRRKVPPAHAQRVCITHTKITPEILAFTWRLEESLQEHTGLGGEQGGKYCWHMESSFCAKWDIFLSFGRGASKSTTQGGIFDLTPAARGLEELFSAVLEKFLEPILALHVYCKN